MIMQIIYCVLIKIQIYCQMEISYFFLIRYLKSDCLIEIHVFQLQVEIKAQYTCMIEIYT